MKYLLLGLFSLCTVIAVAQDLTWKQHEKLGDELMAQGQYANAADNYELAWEQKPSKRSLLAKAADAYRYFRDYQKAADCYKPLINEKEFPLAQWHYGRSMKQLGQYQIARASLQSFLDQYNGPDQATLLPLVREELRGCGLAQEWSKTEVKDNLQYLAGLNSKAAEFSPLPFSEDILYFSSTRKGAARIFRSQRSQGKFSGIVEPDLPRAPQGHFCHGSFAPNNERFYFTVCAGEENWQGVRSKCELYVTMREDNSWTAPQKMRDYVKMDGTTVTHPFVVHQGDTEILYFSSDRSGGQGGMDIWFMTRQIVGRDIDFTYPINAGSVINTAGDEVSPFYDVNTRKLYFSSDGQINIGGFDVLMAKGQEQEWQAVENLGPTVNSSADDYYYFPSPSGDGAYFVSNRSYGGEKGATTNDDLFFIPSGEVKVSSGLVSGMIFDQVTGMAIENVEVAIYEKVDMGLKRLLKSSVSQNGNYEFPIIPERDFLIECTKDGYVDASFEFNTYEFDGSDPGRPIYLEKRSVASTPKRPKAVQTEPIVSSTPITPSQRPTNTSSSTSTRVMPEEVVNTTVSASTEMATKGQEETRISQELQRNPAPASNREIVNHSASTTPAPVTQAPSPKASTETLLNTNSSSSSESSKTYTNSRFNRDGVTTDAPRHNGTYFKVQLSVVIDYDLEGAIFQSMQEYGRLDTEYIIEKGWTRVLLADFFSLEEARQMMDKSRLLGFPEAFIVRYVDGYRKN